MLSIGLDTLLIIVVIILVVVIFPIVYVKFISGLANRVLSRIISTNFTLSIDRARSLIFGYLIGTLIFSSIIYNLYVKSMPIGTTIVPQVVFASSLSFCFTARVITREYGYTYGKQYVAVLSALSSILLLMKVFIFADSFDFSKLNISLFNIHALYTLYNIIYDFISSTYLYLKDSFGLIIVSVSSVTLVGEKLLARFKGKNRSMSAFFEKMDLDLVPIPTQKQAQEKIEEMISNNVKSIKLISRNLTLFETLQKRNFGKPIEFKIIAPDFSKTRYIPDENYEKRLQDLKNASDSKLVTWQERDFNSLRVLIINNEKIILILRSGDTRGRKTCLYSDNPYIVKHFVQIFDGFFD